MADGNALPIRIGLFYDFPQQGDLFAKSVQLGIDEVAASGRRDRAVELVERDARGLPAGSEAEVARRFQRYRELLAPLGSPLERLILSPRYAWQLRLADGMVIELGRDAPNDPVDARLARLVAVYAETIGRIARKHEYVDLRYPNGFALRVPDLKGG